MDNIRKDMGVQDTGENFTNHSGRLYLKQKSNELNILADVIENHLDLRYTTNMINCRCHQEFFYAVCKYTINLSV